MRSRTSLSSRRRQRIAAHPARRKASGQAAAISLRKARASAWAIVRATAGQAWADRVFGLAAEAGFWALLSLTPLLLVLVAAVGYLTPLFGAHLVVQLERDILRGAGHFMAPAAGAARPPAGAHRRAAARPGRDHLAQLPARPVNRIPRP